MAMVSADASSQSFGRLTAQIGWFGLRVGGHLAVSMHSSYERVNSRNDYVMMTAP